jgi:hypothetical protein
MATYTKNKLSGSTSGTPILIAAITGTGDTIHTAVASTGAAFDEIWLYANNTSTSPVLLTVQYGGTTTKFQKPITLAPQSGDVLVVAGLILQNSLVVSAIAATTNVITISGYVNSIA